MTDREIGMDPMEGTSCTPLGQRYKFPSEAHCESTVPLVPASLTYVEAQKIQYPQPHKFHWYLS